MKLCAGREQDWDKTVEVNLDAYGKAVIDYAVRWAELMEAKMESGEQLEKIAESTGGEADTEGITGYMYGAAVSVLVHHWEHGERLRRWHNLDVQFGDEGERANEREGATLNPALLRIG